MNIDRAKVDDRLEHIQATTDHLLQRSENGWVVGHFFNNRLSSVFQPVFDAPSRNVAGHAAYIRSESDRKTVLSPWGVFALASEDARLVKLDRLCRTIHAINYFTAASGHGILFVSVQPRLLESVKDDHGYAFKKILDLIEVETSQVVVEIPIEVNRDPRLLKHVIGNYRSRGYKVAVNHSGTKENWVAGLADLCPLYPDIVRLEASALLPHSGPGPLVDAIHRLEASLLVHEIETTQQMTAAINAGADFLQGRLLGMPVGAIEAGAPAVHGRTIADAGGLS
jgi:EAL domain-containing protein (putative c-di-GMP-specific phosphodiesterase class I)